jgi:hypothetical protein
MAHWFADPPESLESLSDERSGLIGSDSPLKEEPVTPEVRQQFYYFPPDSSDVEGGFELSPSLTPWSILLMVHDDT